MGWAPWKVTYASQYFERLHELAVALIKAGKAFVCHQVGVELWVWCLAGWLFGLVGRWVG
jgi:glutaminyl-tRNA synthetase